MASIGQYLVLIHQGNLAMISSLQNHRLHQAVLVDGSDLPFLSLPFRIIDFTKPYLSTGVTFLYKPPAVPASSWDRQLLGVFAIELWLLVGASFIITAIALMFLQVPFG